MGISFTGILAPPLEEFYVRNAEGYGLKNGRVTDSWSKVRHLSVFISRLTTLVDSHPHGRIPGGLRRIRPREQCGLNGALRAGKRLIPVALKRTHAGEDGDGETSFRI